MSPEQVCPHGLHPKDCVMCDPKPFPGKTYYATGLMEVQQGTSPLGKRSHTALPFHLIPMEAQKLEAERFAYGLNKYGVGNWLKFTREQYIDAWNHMYEHMLSFRNGDVDDNIPSVETHLGAIRFNCAVIAWGLAHGKVTLEDFSEGVTFGPKLNQERG